MGFLSSLGLWACLCATGSSPSDTARPAAVPIGDVGWYTVTSAGTLLDKVGPYVLSGGICQSPICAPELVDAGAYHVISGFWSFAFSASPGPHREEVLAASVAPGAFRLYRNHPNPFRRGTRIAYDLPAAGRIWLAVFDAAGRRVKELISGEQAPGRYDLYWDGRDKSGRSCPAGVYFCSLKTEYREAVRKMLIAE